MQDLIRKEASCIGQAHSFASSYSDKTGLNKELALKNNENALERGKSAIGALRKERLDKENKENSAKSMRARAIELEKARSRSNISKSKLNEPKQQLNRVTPSNAYKDTRFHMGDSSYKFDCLQNIELNKSKDKELKPIREKKGRDETDKVLKLSVVREQELNKKVHEPKLDIKYKDLSTQTSPKPNDLANDLKQTDPDEDLDQTVMNDLANSLEIVSRISESSEVNETNKSCSVLVEKIINVMIFLFIYFRTFFLKECDKNKFLYFFGILKLI